MDLAHFTLQGKAMKEFRHIINKMEKFGIRTQVFEPPMDEKTMLQLQKVSDDWLGIQVHVSFQYFKSTFQKLR